MDDELEKLTEKLRRGREKIEKALSDTMTGRTEDLVKRISKLRDRIEGHGTQKPRNPK